MDGNSILGHYIDSKVFESKKKELKKERNESDNLNDKNEFSFIIFILCDLCAVIYWVTF